MRKRLTALMTAGCMILSAYGCGKEDPERSEVPTIPIIIEDDDINALDTDPDGTGANDPDITDADGSDTDRTGTNDAANENRAGSADAPNTDGSAGTGGDTGSDSASLSFDDLKHVTFWFASGAGAWATEMSIRADGSFAGEFHDSDMGSFNDSYPNGTKYQCTFNGQFSQPERVNDYTFSMRILSISYAKEPDTSEIRDGVLYHYTTPYGLDEAETILIYLPGAPLAELPEGYRSWVGYYYLENTTDTELPFYGLYNEAEAEGFSSFDQVDSLKDNLAYIEEQATAIEDAIEHDPALSQAELNVKSGELYELWDSILNIIWDDLKRMTDAETMRALTDEQLAWIAEKNAAVEAAGAEIGLGSLHPLIVNMKAAELTKARVYELLALLDA